ncbi:MAG: tRNA (adenosine(37)-N6)-threonylcarbamoyltransferase complex transferase subunit TsaD [Flavobacteriia bacterium]|nr:tRNA (adenosine(37)-N6)-threonylcarbamoyltransferase complex transferase subunit TsaD [Flavobacteriia bacterium]
MSEKSIHILGIESSCDDTSAAILCNTKVLSNITAGQKVHEMYGGVVPELASRAHQQNIVPVVDTALKNAGINLKDIDAIAFTSGPGLLGSLMVGTSFAKGLALALSIPLIEVHHMKAHILAHLIDDPEKNKPTFPFLCLTVSGGHTQLVLVHDYNKMEIIGSTIDDAAGECFDKSAKMLGLPYPGGPFIDQYAQKGDPNKFFFSKPKVPDFNYSFSGLKTSILYFLQKETAKNKDFIQQELNSLCASIQESIIDVLFDKLILVTQKLQINQVAIAGGVSANSALRKRLLLEGQKRGWQTFIPKFEYCTDNAAMIAVTGYFSYLQKDFVGQDVVAKARRIF